MSEPTMKQIRASWKERLLKAELPEEVVDGFLAGVPDADLVRMKDLSDEQLLATLREALDTETDEEEDEEEDEESTESTTKEDLAKSLGALADMVATRVKDMITETFGTVEVEVPELGQLMKDVAELKEQTEALAVAYKEMTATWKEVGTDDKDRIRGLVQDLSPAQRQRLRVAISTPEVAARAASFRDQVSKLPPTAFPTPQQPSRRPEPGAPGVLPPTTSDGIGIYDAEGNAYSSLTAMATGKPNP